MYKKLLTAINNEECSEQVFSKALALAKQFDATLALKNIVEISPIMTGNPQYAVYNSVPFEQEAARISEKHLKKMINDKGDNEIRWSVEIGALKQVMAQTVEKEHIDLTVVGNRRRYGLEKLIGSNAHKILNGVSSDVYIVNIREKLEENKNKIKNILVAVDFDDEINSSLLKAKCLANIYDANIVLAHVVKKTPLTDIYYDSFQDDVETDVSHQLDVKISNTNIAGAKKTLLYGSIAKSVCNYALENSIDLIVVGYNNHTVKHIFLGSNASAIVSRAPCDVLVIKN